MGGVIFRSLGLPTLYVCLGCLLVYSVAKAGDQCDSTYKDYFQSAAFSSQDALLNKAARAKIQAGCRRFETHVGVINLATTGRN